MTQYEFYLIQRDQYDRKINIALARRYNDAYLDDLYHVRNHIARQIDQCERAIIDRAKSVTPN